MKKRILATLAAAAVATTLVACGGGGGGSDTTTTSTTPTTPDTTTTQPVSDNKFTSSGTWTFALPATAGATLCYDFDNKVQVADCSGTAWDLKVKSSGTTGSFWTNSGISGTGRGGAFGGPFDHTWADLQTWKNGTTDPTGGALPSTVFLADSASSIFTGTNDIQSAAFEYAVTGGTDDHSLYPNFRVFLVTSDSTQASAVGTVASPVYALQVIGYYGTAGTPPSASGTTSGIVTFRWVDRAAGGAVKTATVDARSGWVYFDLAAGAVSSQAGTWQIAFNRYNIKLNGGESGSGTVAGFVGKTPAGFYDTSSKPIVAKFTATTNVADTLADLTAADIVGPATASAWKKDATTSPLGPAYQGTYPAALDYGWYSYYPTDAAAAAVGLTQHMLKANDTRATLIRTGEGTGYVRFHLKSISYATATPAYSGQQTWTIEFDAQPSQ